MMKIAMKRKISKKCLLHFYLCQCILVWTATYPSHVLFELLYSSTILYCLCYAFLFRLLCILILYNLCYCSITRACTVTFFSTLYSFKKVLLLIFCCDTFCSRRCSPLIIGQTNEHEQVRPPMMWRIRCRKKGK